MSIGGTFSQPHKAKMFPTTIFTPGTHNSGMWRLAKNDFLGNNPYSCLGYLPKELVRERCANVSVSQKRNLVEQYKLGIRAFDIRVAHFRGELRFAHTFLGPRARKWLDRLRKAHKAANDPDPLYIKLRWDWNNREKENRDYKDLLYYLQSCPEILVSLDKWWDSPTKFSIDPQQKLRQIHSWHKSSSSRARWLSWDLTPDTEWVVNAILRGETLYDLANRSHALVGQYILQFPAEVIAIDFADYSFVQLCLGARHKRLP